MNREYHKWFSPRLHREMELLIFGHAGPRAVVFPTREGRFFDYENWGLVGALRQRLEEGSLQLFCVDSVDSESLYCPSCPPRARITRHAQYESYILDEVLPLTEAINPGSTLIAHGCSIGAYHAVNIALRHPARFDKIVALSGRYNLTKAVGLFADLFHGYYDEEIYFHTPNHFVPNIEDPDLLFQMRRLEIDFVIGEDDPFFESNRELSEALTAKDIWHRMTIWEGEAHRAVHWRKMVKLFL